jgi:hypothetical protein
MINFLAAIVALVLIAWYGPEKAIHKADEWARASRASAERAYATMPDRLQPPEPEPPREYVPWVRSTDKGHPVPMKGHYEQR